MVKVPVQVITKKTYLVLKNNIMTELKIQTRKSNLHKYVFDSKFKIKKYSRLQYYKHTK